MDRRKTEILLVEDNAPDVRLTIEVLREGKIGNELHVVRDGADALAFVRRESPYEFAPRPDLILLDLNLPKVNGFEVLRALKGHSDLKRIPVVVLTTSNTDMDRIAAYDLHANSYITKPVNLDDFLSMIRTVESYWLTVVSLPEG